MKTPYFIFKSKRLIQNYKEFESLCKKYFKDFIIAYSVKTNSFGQVIRTLIKESSNFEVASLNEIKLIPKKFNTERKLYFKNRIKSSEFSPVSPNPNDESEGFGDIFNGPCKTDEELKFAVKNNFLINVDSKSELDKISRLTNKKLFDIGLRISVNESKFGFSKEQLKEIIEYAKSLNLNVICLHFHCGTQLSLNEFEKNLENSAEIIKKSNLKLKYINVGGGFPDKTQLKNLNLNLEDYFSAIKKYLGKFDSAIILEPGRCLVADAFELITKVNVIKESFGKKYAILDAGINLLPKITLSTYTYSKLNSSNEEFKKQKSEYILAGPLLFSNDILRKFYGNLKEGDLIKIENVGAYCYNLAWTISYKKPKIYIEK